MNQFECMKMFVQVIERSGFARAAIALQMSPAKVSTQISNLEEHLGVQLLSRTTRTFTLTEEGEAYYAHCKRVLAEIAETEALFSASRAMPRGRLRIDAPVTFLNRLLLPVLERFRARYPEIELELLHSEHVFDLQHSVGDVQVRMGPLQDSGLVARPLGYTTMVTAAAPAYLARRGEPKAPCDLMNHECINYMESNTGRPINWEFERKGERVVIRPHAGIAFNQGESRLAAAIAGMGIYRGLRIGLDSLLADRALKLILQDWATPSPPIFVVYERHKHLSIKVRAFVDFMLECYPPDQPIELPRLPASDVLQRRA